MVANSAFSIDFCWFYLDIFGADVYMFMCVRVCLCVCVCVCVCDCVFIPYYHFASPVWTDFIDIHESTFQ